MYDRRKFKEFALKQLKGRWGIPILVTVVAGLISAIFQLPVTYKMFSSQSFYDFLYYSGHDLVEFLTLYSDAVNGTTTRLMSFIQIFVASVLEIAVINVYINMSRSPEPVKFTTFLEGLNLCLKAILGTLWQILWVTLWTLLFIIPGIVRSIAYSQMFYILCEYKNVSVTKSMRISIIITRGHKWDLFVTYLSFLGWYLLCILSLGIGFLWLVPYMNMTLTNAYHSMLKEAIEMGKITPEDLTE